MAAQHGAGAPGHGGQLESSLTAAVLDVAAGRAPLLDDVEPVRLAALLTWNGLAGLAVSDARQRAGSEGGGLPADLSELLRPTYHATALHTTLLLESAQRAVATLADAGLPALLFKGAALLSSGVYADPGGRPIEDVDLLVRPDHAADAVAVLAAEGFVPWSPWTPTRMGWVSSFTFSDAVAPHSAKATVDLHWSTPYRRLRQSGPWRVDSLWEGAVGHLPAPEPHFVVIAEHFLKHLRVATHFRGVADLARLAPRLSDAELLLSQCRDRGSLSGVRLILAWLDSVVGVPVAPAVLQRLGVPSELRGRARSRLDPARLLSTESNPPSGGVSGIVEDWLLIGSPLRGALELVRAAAPSGRWLRDRYPSEGAPLRRARYVREILSWALGTGRSPLSPNQDG